MRIFLVACLIFSVGSIVSAAYSDKIIENPHAYAHHVSQKFALGDNDEASGWRDCVEMENDGKNTGLACDGVRSILVHGGRMFDVNYYCEFRFIKRNALEYLVESEFCE